MKLQDKKQKENQNQNQNQRGNREVNNVTESFKIKTTLHSEIPTTMQAVIRTLLDLVQCLQLAFALQQRKGEAFLILDPHVRVDIVD